MLQLKGTQQTIPYTNKQPIQASCPATSHDVATYRQLASLSRGRQWILYTAQCPRPSHELLCHYDINCSTVIHMKPSLSFSEEEIVIKAIQARNASAIVASHQLTYNAKTRIMSYAAEYGCQIFFLHDSRTIYPNRHH